jgi:hypothetical protein
MILRRIAEAIRQRNGFSVLFEIMIVVLGAGQTALTGNSP